MNGDGRNRRAAIELSVDGASCEIWPHLGGSIGRWTVGGQDMFRSANADALLLDRPTGMASFPLVPFSNRIGFGRFSLNGNEVSLKRNFPPEQHSIHGTGWTAAWDAEPIGNEGVLLRYCHIANDHWPWPFEAEQHISLSPETLSLTLVVCNLSDSNMPLAFGHHPYFESAGATLSFQAAKVWLTGRDGLPSRPETPDGVFDFTNGKAVTGRTLDNGFAGWDGIAHIRWADRPLCLDIEADMTAAVVYVPKHGDFFCFEPVPHIINALNLPDHLPQMSMVAPGDHLESQIRFTTRATPRTQTADSAYPI